MKKIFLVITALMLVFQSLRAQNQNQDSIKYDLAMLHYNSGKINLCVQECNALIKADGYYADDARVLLAMCRDSQGFYRVARRMYRKLVAEDNASAAYHYASMLVRRGHYTEAEKMLQKAIIGNKSNADAHLMLAMVKANQGERFKAMMPLYYFLLINNDEEKQITAYNRLISLWRQSAKAINLVNAQRHPDPFNDKTDNAISTWTTSDSIAHANDKEQIEKLASYTQQLFSYLLNNSEQNLDFWQVAYTDFFVKLVPRNFVTPFVYHISDATHHAEVLEWLSSENGNLFNEFRLWMEAQY